MAGAVYETETIEQIRAASGAGDVVHAGTFFGDFLPAIATALAPSARVWAFEPNPNSARCARVTCELNGLDNVALAEAALSRTAGDVSFVVEDLEGAPLGGASHVGESKGALSVETQAIDEVIPQDRHVTVIHLDVEGHEVEALEGALETIARCRPLLLVETCPEADWLAENLAPLGYAITGQVCKNTILTSARAE
ncbi:MAG: FkbM family methyltransferase [Pseudomonadota bacterium]